MRKKCINMIYELAKADSRVIFIGSDLSPGLLDDMKKEMPERHYMEGIAEANIIGMAAGMAMEGYIPYVNTISTFITRRAFEQVVIDVCLHHLPVRLIGNGGGFVYAPLGPTHQAIEDIASMRSIPNMTVVAVSDADEMERLMRATIDWPHPIYIRLGKGGEEIVSNQKNGFEIGKAIHLVRDPEAQISILSTGILASRAINAAKTLKKMGYGVEVVHHHTVKPIDENSIIETAKTVKNIITIEEHSLVGGFGSAVAEVLMDKNLGKFCSLTRMGIPDCFSKNYGSQNEILEHFGLTSEQIVKNSKRMLNEENN